MSMSTMEAAVWVEKYRPKTLDEMWNQKSIVAQLKEIVRTKTMTNCLFAGSPGCLAGDERVILQSGIVEKMQDLGVYHLQPIDIKLRTGKKNNDSQTATTFHKYDGFPILEVVTETGRSLKGTYNHPILTRRKLDHWRSADVWKRLDELEIGDRVRVIQGACLGTNVGYRNTGWFTAKTKHRKFQVTLPSKLNEALAAVFGLFVADGTNHYNRELTFYLAENEIDVIDQLRKIAKSLFDAPISVSRRHRADGSVVKMWMASIYRTPIATAFSGIIELKQKRIPRLVWLSKNSVMAYFLRWLFEGDGGVNISFVQSRHRTNYLVYLKSKELELLRDVQFALLRWRIHSRILPCEGNYILRIHQARSVIRFSRYIGFVGDVKKHEMKLAVKTASLLDEDRLRHGTMYERITQINMLPPEPVFDVEIPNGHQFVANGFVSHNTGKTTAALCLAHDLFGDAYSKSFLELNASDARGIDVIRTIVKEFARMAAIGTVPFKILVLDESDSLTSDAQHALRRTMERYTATCRFILSCNYSNKIIEPIHSRCGMFRFKRYSAEELGGYVDFVAEKEKVSLSPDGRAALLEISEGDMRSAVNTLQAASIVGQQITADSVYAVVGKVRSKDVQEMLELAMNGKFMDARKKLRTLIVEEGFAGSDIIKQVHSELLRMNIPEPLKLKISETAGEVDFRMSQGANDEIQMSALLAKLAVKSTP